MKWQGEAVRAWVAGVLAGCYKPLPKEEIWEWAERTLKIPRTENKDLAGRLWSSSLTPYVRIVMKWVKRPGKGEFWIQKSSQVGFTMAVLIIICWMIVHRPGPVAYAIDTIAEARNISKTRLQRWLTENKILEKAGEDPDDMNNLIYYLRGMTLYMLGANSAGGFSNKSVELFILDEYDLHEELEGHGTTGSQARDRTKVPKNAKIIGFSKPGKTGQIGKECARGTMEEVRFPWPCCGHVQALRRSHFVYEAKEFQDLAGAIDLEKVREGAYFKCELCGGKLLDHQKMAAMQDCDGYPTNPKPEKGVRSLYISDAYSPFVTFGTLGVELIEAQKTPGGLESHMPSRWGEYHVREGGNVKHDSIKAARAPYVRGRLHFVPYLMVAAIDKQSDVQKAVKVAFDEKGNGFVVDWFTSMVLQEAVEWCREPVPCGPCRLEEVRGPHGEVAEWRVIPEGDEELVPVTNALIDEGYRMDETRRMCLANLPVFWPVKGRGNVQVRHLWNTSPSVVDGEPLLTYHVAEDSFKWDLLKRITDRLKKIKRGDPVMSFPIDVEDDESFLDEMCNESPVQKKDKRGKLYWEWKVKGANDYWDCVKYCLCILAIRDPQLKREGMNSGGGQEEAA